MAAGVGVVCSAAGRARPPHGPGGLRARLTAEPATTLAAVLDELGERHAAAPALLSDREIFSFAEMASRARRYTRWARAAGLASGDVIALLAPNRPDYLIAWAGITRVGATVALLNTHLAGPSLAHCINVAQAGHVIVAAEFADAYRDASPYLANTVEAWSYDGDATLQGMAAVDLHPYSGRPLEADDTPEARLSDRAADERRFGRGAGAVLRFGLLV